MKILKEISSVCHTSQTFSRRSLTFKVRFPGGTLFNKEIVLDILYLENFPVLHIIDCGTNFSATRFLPAVKTETVRNTFLLACFSCYLCYLQNVRTEQGSCFTSEMWVQNARMLILNYFIQELSHIIHWVNAKHITAFYGASSAKSQ